MSALALTALGVGLLGGVHCVAMCGGVVSAYAVVVRRAPPAAAQLRFNAGRIASYVLAGALAGGVSATGIAAARLLPLQTLLFVAANGLLILLGLHLAGRGSLVLRIEQAGAVLSPAVRGLGRRLPSADTPAGQLAAGALWGWTPCGLVYSMLALALVSGSAGHGALVMAAFGLGTLPNLLGAGWLLSRFGAQLRRPRVRAAAGTLIAGFGLVGLARVPGLAQQVSAGLLCLGGQG